MAGGAGVVVNADEIQVLRLDRDSVPLPGRGEVRAVVWPGMGAQHRSMHWMRLAPGETSDEWRHPGEAVYYVLSGSGWFQDRTAGMRHDVRAGLIVHVEAGTTYTMTAREPLVCIGGPCPADPALYVGMSSSRPRGRRRGDGDASGERP